MITIPYYTFLETTVVDGASITYFSSGSDILDNFASVFSTAFEIITSNPALSLIVTVAVGVPVIGAVLAVVRGR